MLYYFVLFYIHIYIYIFVGYCFWLLFSSRLRGWAVENWYGTTRLESKGVNREKCVTLEGMVFKSLRAGDDLAKLAKVYVPR